ncbi:MAG: hypothetical protein HDR80_02765, partial [Bacteroides sp.]|nr:hypothetical protein [Bacteroides sp.]
RGIPPEHLRPFATGIPGWEILSLLPAEEISATRRREIIAAVAEEILPQTERWYVMRLRQGVDFYEVRTALEDAGTSSSHSITYFYPERPVRERVGKRLVMRRRPYLPGLVFFRTRRERIPAIFRTIGHLAWCYRVTAAPGADYSVIPAAQMRRFQMQVEQFTEDVTLELVSDPMEAYSVGEEVRVIGGDHSGYEGEILKMRRSDGATVFTLRLAAGQYLRWTLDIDPRLIERTTSKVS